MSIIPIGWDCYHAMNAEQPVPPGGRALCLGGWPWSWQDIYVEVKGALATPASHLFVDGVKWLRGGRTTGTIAIPTDSVDYSWYVPYEHRARAETDAAIGTAVKDALTAVGFTVYEYSGVTFPFLSSVDVLFLSLAQSGYNTTTYNSQFMDFFNNEGGLMCAEALNIHTQDPFKFGTGYAYTTPAQGCGPTSYSGAEAIFERCMTAGGVEAYETSNWDTGRGGRCLINPSAPAVYPDGKSLNWVQPTFYSSSNQEFGPTGCAVAYTLHSDAGDGTDWSVG